MHNINWCVMNENKTKKGIIIFNGLTTTKSVQV